MKHTKIKKVITKTNKEIYYLGNGCWFGRIAKNYALAGLESGKFSMWETIDYRETNKEVEDDYVSINLELMTKLAETQAINNTIH